MAELKTENKPGKFRIRYRGRGAQVGIYLGKLLRMFIYQNDWKVLPMAALIAGLVGMVIRKKMFINMEGTLMGAFALVCVCIWNGCFNSIQVICRERDVIKREHRSGMHISSYIFSHMLYQALLCLAQTGGHPDRDPVRRRAVSRGGPDHAAVRRGLCHLHVPDHLRLGHDVPVGVLAGAHHHDGHDHHALRADLPAGVFRRHADAAGLDGAADAFHHFQSGPEGDRRPGGYQPSALCDHLRP